MDSDLEHGCDYTIIMHLGIDIREACRDKRTGKGQWTFSFAQELLRRDADLSLFTDNDLPSEWNSFLKNRRGITHVINIRAPGIRWHIAAKRKFLESSNIDVYVSTVSYILPFLVGSKKKVVPIVHDLIAFRGEPHEWRSTFIERLTLGKTIRNAHHVCTVSDTTKKDLLQRYSFLKPSDITPIFAAPSLAPIADNERSEEIILCAATLCPRKNQKGLIEAHRKLSMDMRKRFPLVLIGARGWMDEDIVRLAEQTPHVTWKQYVPNEEYRLLLARCAVFAYPSFYEGFGLPLLEAMQSGIPVLTSNIGSMKEVAGDAAVLIHPQKIDSITEGLEALLSKKELRRECSDAGKERSSAFTWKRTVDSFLGAL